jgi:hypothetical protein
MTNNPELFCYWLQGFFELSNSETITPLQVKVIKDHLNLVFKKETPNITSDILKEFPDSFSFPKSLYYTRIKPELTC